MLVEAGTVLDCVGADRFTVACSVVFGASAGFGSAGLGADSVSVSCSSVLGREGAERSVDVDSSVGEAGLPQSSSLAFVVAFSSSLRAVERSNCIAYFLCYLPAMVVEPPEPSIRVMRPSWMSAWSKKNT